MPPEQLCFAEEKCTPAKLDVWSCGMVLYACLAGFLPYCGDTTDAKALLDEITTWEELEFPEWFSDGACDVISKALDRDVTRRIDMHGLRNHAWTRGVDECEEGGREEENEDMKRKYKIPGFKLDGSFGVQSLEFSSPVSPDCDEFENAGCVNGGGVDQERIDMWKL